MFVDFAFADFDWSILDPKTRKQIQDGYHKFWSDCELACVDGKVIRTDIPRKKPLTHFDFHYEGETSTELCSKNASVWTDKI